MQVEHVAPQVFGRLKRFLIVWQADGFILIKFKQAALRVLHGVKDPVHT